MVGWWKTLIGDLYEHVTIWEYDDMAAFERAIQFLSKNSGVRQVRGGARPALGRRGEPIPAAGRRGERPSLPEPAPFVVHEIHRVPWRRRCLSRVHDQAGPRRAESKRFRPVGPWIVEVGRWSEVTYLFRYESLAERERMIAKFRRDPDGPNISRKIGELTEEITTRLLMPAPFAPRHQRRDAPAKRTRRPGCCRIESRLPRELRRRVCRPLSLRQLRLGRAGGRDAAHRLAARNAGRRSFWSWSPRRPVSPRAPSC